MYNIVYLNLFTTYILWKLAMMIDTHCHINMMVKSEFDRLLSPQECSDAQSIINQAQDAGVSYIINVYA